MDRLAQTVILLRLIYHRLESWLCLVMQSHLLVCGRITMIHMLMTIV
jgi:hypothetical protein